MIEVIFQTIFCKQIYSFYSGERLFIANDLEFINARSLSEIAPTLTLFKRSINIKSSCCPITSVSSK